MKDYTLIVYTSERVKLTDSNGATSDPTNGGQKVNPKITDTNTTVVATNTTTNTNSNTNTNVVNTTTVVVTPTPTPVVVDTVTPKLLAKALTQAISDAAANSTAYPATIGSYYSIKKGFTPQNSTYYFWQYAATSTTFNLDVSVTLKSVGQTCVTDQSTAISYATQSDGTLWCTNDCIIEGKSSQMSCNYIMNA